MAMLVISTQIHENYGAHAWDGKGACPQHWKAKGGHEYKVLNIDPNLAAEIFSSVEAKCTQDDDYYSEYVLDWSVESDDYLSWFERSQLEYEGTIAYPEPVLEVV